MKNIIFILLLYVVIDIGAFAEKAISLSLLVPIDFSKNISKDKVIFTWVASQNQGAKFRIVISENLKFNGYNFKIGKCNATCIVGVTNTPTYSTSLALSNKTYYWHVQEIGDSGNSDWSHTNSFKTDNGIPSIINASVSPNSTTIGSSVNFSAILSGNLPNGYSVKLSYGANTFNMLGSNTSYSLSQIPSTLGQQVFKVGIYDNSNTLKGTVLKGNFELVKGNSAPTLILISGDSNAMVGTSYSIQLQAGDIDNNLRSIKIDWGDGKSDLQIATNGTTITFIHTYPISGAYKLIATSIDADLTNSISVSKVLIISNPNNLPNTGTGKLNDTGITNCANEISHSLKCPVAGYENQDAESGLDKIYDTGNGHAGFNFTRISLNSGHECVQDNITGLMWEVKVNDSSSLYNYTWYETDNIKNGGSIGKENGGICSLNKCDTSNYIKKLNEIGYCGYKDWRLPTYSELLSIVNFDKNTPSIDTEYFPYTKGIKNYYWTASPISQQIDLVWIVDFNSGEVLSARKSEKLYVRLVRG